MYVLIQIFTLNSGCYCIEMCLTCAKNRLGLIWLAFSALSAKPFGMKLSLHQDECVNTCQTAKLIVLCCAARKWLCAGFTTLCHLALR